MRVLVEIGRFIAISLAIAVAIPTVILIVSLAMNEPFSFEVFFALGAISFVIAVLGGIFVGLPALWLARTQRWERDIRRLAIFGCLTGAAGGVLMNILFWQGDWNLVTDGVFYWIGMGAFAGLIASVLWYWLHLSDAENCHHA